MTEQMEIQGIPSNIPNAQPAFVLVTELEIQAARRKIIEADGDLEAAGISLEEMRNIIYTCRMKANPMQEDGEAPAKPKKVKTPSTNVGKISGDDINSFLG